MKKKGVIRRKLARRLNKNLDFKTRMSLANRIIKRKFPSIKHVNLKEVNDVVEL